MSDLDVRPTHPDHVGPYRILRVLGEGGMGMVYEAEQSVPIHRRVAVKVVRAEIATREVLARFDAERQALAVMTHEAIAKVLDAGTSETGNPYFVMELVRGVPLTEYCDAHKLSTRDRIALFLPVCRAIQHAHQKGVIHRDLKPSNVLVTDVDGVATPKVIDFGIAKAVGRSLTDQTLVTVFGQAMGTPAYMSPEQAEMSGLDIDTRTDVYSLGIMLYELLVGRLPLDPREVGIPSFMARLVMRTTDAPTPSAKLDTLAGDRKVLAMLRRTDPDGMRRQLRGDLDWIIMRAIEQDRTRRYETANGLALDLSRHLTDQPVEARPPTPTYRMRKFARRHRAGVAAAGIVAATVVVGAVAATAGFVRATRAETRARADAATAEQVAAFLTGLFKVSDPSRARGTVLTARAILDSGAKKIETDLAGQPLVQARLTQTIGDVYAAMALYPEAERLLVRSLAARERLLGRGAPEVGDNLTSLGTVYIEEGRYAAAESALTRAIHLTSDPRREGVTPTSTARPLAALSNLYQRQGRYAASDSLSRRAIATLARTLGPASPKVADATTRLAISQAEQGRPVVAESLFRRVLALRLEATGPDHPAVAKALNNLASSLYEQGKLAEAEALYQRALATDTKLYGPTASSVALDLFNLGNVRDDQKQFPQAIALFERARAIWESTFGPDHPYVANALSSMGHANSEAGRYADAIPLLERALAIQERTLAPDHPFIGTSHHELGVALRHLGRLPEAEVHLRRALDIRQKSLDPTSYYTATTLGALGDLDRDRGETGPAERLYAQALAKWDSSGHASDGDRAEIVRNYADLLRREGRGAEATAIEIRTPGNTGNK